MVFPIAQSSMRERAIFVGAPHAINKLPIAVQRSRRIAIVSYGVSKILKYTSKSKDSGLLGIGSKVPTNGVSN